jgi:predicted nucleic acid-binding protein
VKLIFDTNVWIDHLRGDALAPLLPQLRGKYQLWMDALVAAELRAGCRSPSERRVVDGLLAPFAGAGRVRAASGEELADAGRALSKLRQRGTLASGGAGALIDAAIAVVALRLGALLVTANARDFAKLATVLPFHWEPLHAFAARMSART